MKHPLYNQIKSIADNNIRAKRVNNSCFDSIRNKSSVRKIMTDLGYRPNNETLITYWTTGRINNSSTAKRNKSVDTVTNDENFIYEIRNSVKLRNEAKKQVLIDLISYKTVDIDKSGLNRKQMVTTVHYLRERGYDIETLGTYNNSPATGYKRRVIEEGDEHLIELANDSKTASGKEVLFTLLKHGIIYVKDYQNSRDYLTTIISELRKELGYSIECIRPPNNRRNAVAYKLISRPH